MGAFGRIKFDVPLLMVSTNRSLGCQPGIKSRRIFCSSAPQILAKVPAGKKYLFSREYEIKKC